MCQSPGRSARPTPPEAPGSRSKTAAWVESDGWRPSTAVIRARSTHRANTNAPTPSTPPHRGAERKQSSELVVRTVVGTEPLCAGALDMDQAPPQTAALRPSHAPRRATGAACRAARCLRAPRQAGRGSRRAARTRSPRALRAGGAARRPSAATPWPTASSPTHRARPREAAPAPRARRRNDSGLFAAVPAARDPSETHTTTRRQERRPRRWSKLIIDNQLVTRHAIPVGFFRCGRADCSNAAGTSTRGRRRLHRPLRCRRAKSNHIRAKKDEKVAKERT